MVLAAGLGLRMRPLTLLRAKPVLPVLNRPLVHWTMRRLAHAGVREVVVNLHHLPESVVSALGDGRGLGLRIRYSHEAAILGTGGGPRAVRAFFGAQPCLVVNGDVLFDLDLRALLARHRASGARATLALRRNPDTRVYSPVVSDRRGRVLAIAGRPLAAQGVVSLFTGVQALDPALFDQLAEGVSDSVRDLYIPLLAAGESLAGVRLSGRWYDLGRPSLYRDAQLRLLPKGRPLIERTARVSSMAVVRRSVVGARARIGAGARVERCVLWDDVVVEPGSQVVGSILASGAVVRRDERADCVMVLPAAGLAAEPGVAFERHGEMAWAGVS